MENREQMNQAELKIQGAIGAFLKTRGSAVEAHDQDSHLDNDVLTAFVEGNLNEREALPVMNHMADCSFCLHVSAELIKLDLAFAEEAPALAPSAKTEPTRVGEVLGGILSRIFGSNDSAVFAHEEKEEEENEKSDSEEE